jgi:transposase
VAASARVVIGVDTHLDSHHLAVITDAGKPLADIEFPTSPTGHDDAVRWAQSYGTIVIAGVEGTSSYGAGLTRVLQGAGIEVAEVSRPDRAARCRQGKSYPLDAYAAARAALSGHGVAVPKDASTGALRALLSARRSAVNADTAATNQIHALLVTAPAELRDRYRRHNINALVKALGRCRPASHNDATTIAVLTAAKAIAQRAEFLAHQKQDLTAHLDVLVRQINPALRTSYGVGAGTAAQLLVTTGTNPHRLRNEASFAALCGAAPVPASSGKITRHRLSRGGDRAANNALYHIALVRVSGPPAHARLRPAPAVQGPQQERDSAFTQTGCRPRNVQTADSSRSGRRLP